ncbi:hypothetical protein HDV05_002053, partial [Chytridiales sp. JEL 0842]
TFYGHPSMSDSGYAGEAPDIGFGSFGAEWEMSEEEKRAFLTGVGRGLGFDDNDEEEYEQRRSASKLGLSGGGVLQQHGAAKQHT